MVALTTLLVLYTLFNSTSNALPDTAYIKMIDVWFLYCISVLFVIIIVHVAVEHLDKGGQGVMVQPVISIKPMQGNFETKAPNRGETLLRALRMIVVPAAIVAFNTIFWAVLLLSPK